jgi:AcrR family transcriptional regulator
MEIAMPRLSSTRKQLLNTMMKEAIHEAAVSVLAEHGLEGMTMDRVAAAANLAKGSLYCYFESKQELLEFVHARIVGPIAKASDDVMRSELSAPEKLEAMLRIVFDQLAKHHGLFKLLLMDDARILLRPSMRTHRENAIRRFAAAVRQGIEEGQFRACDAEQVAVMLFGAMVELWHRAVAAGEFQQSGAIIRSLVRVFLYGVADPPGPAEKIRLREDPGAGRDLPLRARSDLPSPAKRERGRG